MAQGFDPTIPATNDALVSAPVRTNFAAIWSTNEGAAAPANPVLGTMWVDTSVANVKLKMYDGVSFITLIEHLEDITQLEFAGRQKGFTFNPGGAINPWNINHNLNRFPSVSVVDLTNTQIVPTTVQYIDANNITITFAGVQDGAAYLN